MLADRDHLSSLLYRGTNANLWGRKVWVKWLWSGYGSSTSRFVRWLVVWYFWKISKTLKLCLENIEYLYARITIFQQQYLFFLNWMNSSKDGNPLLIWFNHSSRQNFWCHSHIKSRLIEVEVNLSYISIVRLGGQFDSFPETFWRITFTF